MGKRNCRFVWVYLLCISLLLGTLTGCTGLKTTDLPQKREETKEAGQETASGEEQEITPASESREPFDYLSEEWKSYENIENVKPFWRVVDYREDLNPKHDEKYDWQWRLRATDGKNYYGIQTYGEEETETAYLICFDVNTGKVAEQKLLVTEPELKNARIAGMDAANDGFIIYFQIMNEERKIEHIYVTRVSKDGKIGERFDIFPKLQEQALLEGEFFSVSGKLYYDTRGYYLYRMSDMQSYIVFDAAGEYLTTIEGDVQKKRYLEFCGKTKEGVLIFEESNNTDMKHFYYVFDEETKGFKPLFEGSNEMNAVKAMDNFGRLYYAYNGNLLRWDLVEGKCERIYTGVSYLFDSCDLILCNDVGDIFMFYSDYDRECVYRFAANSQLENITITVAAMKGFVGYYDRGWATDFARKHPGVTITFEECDFDKSEEYQTRMMADLIAGKGPDLFMADREQLEVLYDKGVLEDLTGVFAEDVLNQIFPGVLEHGTIDGKLMAISLYANNKMMYTTKDVWQKDTWTVEEFLQVIKEQEKKGLEEIIEFMGGGTYSPKYLLNYVFLVDLEHSPFLDLEKGECHFNEPLFCEVLETSQKYGTDKDGRANLSDADYEEAAQRMLDGRVLVTDGGGIGSFSMNCALLGEEVVCVGFPTDGESGNFWDCGEAYALNAASPHKEILKEYLQYLLKEPAQRTTTSTIRRDILSENVVWPEWSESPLFSMGNGVYTSLYGKPNGETYLEEYLEAVDTCRPNPAQANTIREIIQEEAAAYFNGDKSVEAVAEIIQKRAQLYLNEHK